MVAILAEPDRLAADLPAATPISLDTLIQEVADEAAGWVRELRVTIGRASALCGLKESQIRYFEELGALQPATTTGRAGASRLYGIADLRRLRVLALLAADYRAAEAAEMVRRHADAIDHDPLIALSTAIAQERSAVADGFFLARIVSQIIAAIQAEIDRRVESVAGTRPLPDTCRPPQVLGLIYPGTRVFDGPLPPPAEVEACAAALRDHPAGALIALCRPPVAVDPLSWAPELHRSTGSDSQTLLFYSPESRPIADLRDAAFQAYVPAGAPEQGLLVALSAPPSDTTLDPDSLAPGRALLLDRLLQLAHAIFQDFRRAAHGRSYYRYRSDGFPLDLTRQSYGDMLALIVAAIFPGDDAGMAALLVPDGLDQPRSLAILAHHHYDDEGDLLARAKIALEGRGQGLCGRAYVSREPYVSLHVDLDGQKVRYAPEEGSRVALAVPLAATWGISPFGVLYLASRSPGQTLDSAAIYSALVIGDILSELLGRWWLTRLRRQQDARLHGQMPAMLAWLDSLDAHGPGFARGVQAVVDRWAAVKDAPDPADLDATLALTVIDINHYREMIQARSNEPFPLYAQQHVTAAVSRVLGPDADCYWFGNDHALLVLHGCDSAQATVIVRRVVDQVAVSPVQRPGRSGTSDLITVIGAIRAMSYRSLRDLACGDAGTLRQQIALVIDLLRTRAGHPETLAPGDPIILVR
ncbi:MerR family transcriptional regulator [Oscillochloris sp. ZM17-4]|uniref:MerR family transcriptional regulator n=1 Tax=Oscillochloris sp. ZM17-4 TaxID=2866714 RepID=UPI001C7350ED|nr:MerR family transcriptional regulator [Oscillochloris sp. ZM17-4]MBX0331416.1 MerR family transcriptional regulator [Oscillochloris sp. ZM17-4]